MIARTLAVVTVVVGVNLIAVHWIGTGRALPAVAAGSAAAVLAVAGTLVYMLRKREVFRLGSTAAWLSVHVWVTAAATALALAHSRFSLTALVPGLTVILAEVILVSGALAWLFALGRGGAEGRGRLWWLRTLHVETSVVALALVAAHAITALYFGGPR